MTPQSGDYYENRNYDIDLALDFETEEVMIQRIDDTHCNPKDLWIKMGSLDNLTRAQVKEIRERTKLTAEPLAFENVDGESRFKVSLSSNDVVLITAKARS